MSMFSNKTFKYPRTIKQNTHTQINKIIQRNTFRGFIFIYIFVCLLDVNYGSG